MVLAEVHKASKGQGIDVQECDDARASYMSINRVDVQHAVKEVARFMAEPNERAWSMLKASGSIACGCVRAPRVETDNDYAGCVLTRKRTTCAHLFHGVNLLEAGRWTQGARSF